MITEVVTRQSVESKPLSLRAEQGYSFTVDYTAQVVRASLRAGVTHVIPLANVSCLVERQETITLTPEQRRILLAAQARIQATDEAASVQETANNKKSKKRGDM